MSKLETQAESGSGASSRTVTSNSPPSSSSSSSINDIDDARSSTSETKLIIGIAVNSNHRPTKGSLQRDKFCDDDFDKLVIDTSLKISLREKSLNEETDCCDVKLEHTDTKVASENGSNCDDESEVRSDKQSKLETCCNGNQSSTTQSQTWSTRSHKNKQQYQEHRARSGLNQPKRPMNAFMVWGQAVRRELHHRFSNVQNALLSKALGRVWRSLDAAEKEPYIRKANVIKAAHKRDYPNYRYQPRRIQERQQQIHQTRCVQTIPDRTSEQVQPCGLNGDKEQVLRMATFINGDINTDSELFSSNNNNNNMQVNATKNASLTTISGHQQDVPKVCKFIPTDDQPIGQAQVDSSARQSSVRLETLQPILTTSADQLTATSSSSSSGVLNGISDDEQANRSKFIQQQEMFDRQQMLHLYDNNNQRSYFHQHSRHDPTSIDGIEHTVQQRISECYTSSSSSGRTSTDQYDTNSNYSSYLIGTNHQQYQLNNHHHHQQQQHQHQHGLLIDDQLGKAQALNQPLHSMPYHLEMNFNSSPHDATMHHHQFNQQMSADSSHLYNHPQQSHQHATMTTIDNQYEHQPFLAFAPPANGQSLMIANQPAGNGCLAHNQHPNCT